MCLTKITAQQLYNNLLNLNLNQASGTITFNMAGVSVEINTTDTVGITLQAWIKQLLINNNIYFNEPLNTQEFPDFFLDDINPFQNMLEIKAFNYSATPAFDIANFESYCSSIADRPYRLDADYLILGYTMSNNGNIRIERIWLHKIWEIAGVSERYALKTQVKRDVIYNIRPNSNFKNNINGPFSTKEEFLYAIYRTLRSYRGNDAAISWYTRLAPNFNQYYGYELDFSMWGY